MSKPNLDGIWDTHVHLLDPTRFPYNDDRTYTPSPALFSDLLQASPGHNYLVVQASVEDGHEGLLTQLRKLHRDHPDRTFRGAVMIGKKEWSDHELHGLHSAGVRCLRLRVPGPTNHRSLASGIKAMLRGFIGKAARQQGWVVSMQLPIQTWASMTEFLRCEMADVTLIAEHCAGLRVPLSTDDVAAFECVLELLREKLLIIKLGGLHRRLSDGVALDALREPIQAFAEAGPTQLIWGSDWPHVNSARSKLFESPHLAISAHEELAHLCAWLSEDAVRLMLCATPSKLFAC